jgi:hypothetical protein
MRKMKGGILIQVQTKSEWGASPVLAKTLYALDWWNLAGI